MKTFRLILLLVALSFSSACALTAAPVVRVIDMRTPTVHAFFQATAVREEPQTSQTEPLETTPTVAPIFRPTISATATPEPATTTVTARPAPIQNVPAFTRPLTETVVVFDDRLNTNWSLSNSGTVDFSVEVDNPVLAGEHAIEMIPKKDFSTLFFTVRQNADENYPRERVLGVQLWLTGGNEYIDLEDLAISMRGSNDHDYWVEGDDSALDSFSPAFQETRLYYLGLNRSIPPNTWVRVELWLDERDFDPDYKYVTGFYLKNDEGFTNPVYIDQVQLIMLPENE